MEEELEKCIIDSIDQALPAGDRPLRMTDVGYSLSRLVQSDQLADTLSDASAEEQEQDEEYLMTALQASRKRRTGVRGRPKAVELGFGRSTTHKLPPEAARLMGAANVAFVQRRYNEAESSLLKVIQMAPNSHEPYHTMGLVCEERGERDRAAGFFLLAGLLNPSDWELWIKLADWSQTTDSRGKQQEAVFCLGRAIAAMLKDKNCDSAQLEDLFFRRARLYLSLGQGKEAIQSFGRLVNVRLEDVQLVKRLAKLAIAQEWPSTGADILERACRLAAKRSDPCLSWSHANLLLELLFLAGDIPDYSRIIRVVCEFTNGPLGDQSVFLSNPAVAGWSEEERSKLLLSTIPVEIYLKFAIAALNSGDKKHMVDPIKCVIGDDTDIEVNAELIFACGGAFYSQSMYEECLHVLLPLLRSDVTWSVGACLQVAQCYEKTGQLDEAISAYSACLAADPGCEDARLGLAGAYKTVGDEAAVVETLEGGRAVRKRRQTAVQKESFLEEEESEEVESEEEVSGSDDVWDEGEMGEGQFILRTVRKFAAERRPKSSRRKKSAKKTKSDQPTPRRPYPKEECIRVRQEFTRIGMQLDIGYERQRQLFVDALSAAQELLKDGLSDNPNTRTASLKWAATVDWETEEALLRGLLLTEWADLACRYAASMSVHRPDQVHVICRFLFQLITDTLLGRLASSHDAVRLRIVLAELAVKAMDGRILLESLRYLLHPSHPFIADHRLWAWLSSLLPTGCNGRLLLLSSTPFTRFLHRIILKCRPDHPGRDALLSLEGAIFTLTGSWEEALRSFLQIRSDTPLRSFLLATAYMHRAMQRTCGQKKWYLIKALTCLDCLGQASRGSPYSLFDRGRVYMGVGFWEDACRLLVEALNEDDVPIGLRRTAAYSLSLLIRQHDGNPEAAEAILKSNAIY